MKLLCVDVSPFYTEFAPRTVDEDFDKSLFLKINFNNGLFLFWKYDVVC